jgi:hypothetical protein
LDIGLPTPVQKEEALEEAAGWDGARGGLQLWEESGKKEGRKAHVLSWDFPPLWAQGSVPSQQQPLPQRVIRKEAGRLERAARTCALLRQEE